MNITQQRYLEAKELIPFGVQLLSKKPETFCEGYWPAYYTKAKGCEVWDLDNKHYYDFSTNGISACLLGFASDPVVEAVTKRVINGSMCSQNPAEEVELAERLCQIHPWASKVRFARGGGEIASVAIRIARATTGKDVVAICGYHGWTDWYLAANLGETPEQRDTIITGMTCNGVPESLRGTTVAFYFDDKEGFDRIVAQYGDRLAAVVLETARSTDPIPGFLEHVRAETKRVGALMILDEITIGWRNCFSGYHMQLGITPDMAIFGKATGNGHPISAVIGTDEAMEGANRAFISSTMWTESVGPTAALATLKEMERVNAWKQAWDSGSKVINIWKDISKRYGIGIEIEGFDSHPHFTFNENHGQLRPVFIRLMLDEGFLGNTVFSATVAHNDENIALYAMAFEKVFAKLADILKKGDLEQYLPKHIQAGFGRLVK